ncbi:MAG: hypothetical protein WCJ30_09370, partial [Deltaproteobacteria bacterium]
PAFLPWLVGAAVNPMKYIFNEPYRRRTLRDRFDAWRSAREGDAGGPIQSVRGAPRIAVSSSPA